MASKSARCSSSAIDGPGGGEVAADLRGVRGALRSPPVLKPPAALDAASIRKQFAVVETKRSAGEPPRRDGVASSSAHGVLDPAWSGETAAVENSPSKSFDTSPNFGPGPPGNKPEAGGNVRGRDGVGHKGWGCGFNEGVSDAPEARTHSDWEAPAQPRAASPKAS
mmetsp:Transcript_113018/g.314273  ORF Transcript_113018/g.314273 Transcript_113018/m.314273 type:complete len:166 (+) Transcript_113018:281-778(+)